MRRLPVSARRYMYAGVAPGAASLARSLSPLLSLRPPERKRNPNPGEEGRGESRSRLPTPPTGTPRGRGGGEEEDAGSGGALKGQGAVFCLPIFHFPSSTTALRRLI